MPMIFQNQVENINSFIKFINIKNKIIITLVLAGTRCDVDSNDWSVQSENQTNENKKL